MKCALFHPLDQSPLEILLGPLNNNIKCESCVLYHPCSSPKSYQWYCITNSKENFECNTTLLRNLGRWSMKHNNKCTFMILIKLHWHTFVQKCSQIEIFYFANFFFYQHTKLRLTHIQILHKPHKCNINMFGKSLIPFQFYKPCNT
jgi:hypothetical protein